MVKYLIALIFIFLLLCFDSSFMQQEINEKNKQLQKVKDEIKKLEEELNQTTSREKKNYALLEKYSLQGHLINKVIGNYKNEVDEKEKDIRKLESEVDGIETEIKRLKKNYEKYVVAIYKKMNYNLWLALLEAESIKQAVLRYKYFQSFSKQRKRDLNKLSFLKEELIVKKNELEVEKSEKNKLLAEKMAEEKLLAKNIDEQKKQLSLLRNDKTALKKELDQKKKAEKEISNLIAKLIEKENERKREEAIRKEREQKKSETTSKEPVDIVKKNESKEVSKEKEVNLEIGQYYDTKSFASFSSLKGKMRWPVSGGTVIRKFGENKNTKLNTVTVNYGIDIKLGNDKTVRSVGEGVVSAIEWLPGYGSIIIITHRDEFRTVFGHIAQIYVKEGDKISAGQLIGTVGESLEGFILHFEIWNNRSYQDPEIWLAKK